MEQGAIRFMASWRDEERRKTEERLARLDAAQPTNACFQRPVNDAHKTSFLFFSFLFSSSFSLVVSLDAFFLCFVLSVSVLPRVVADSRYNRV